MPEFQTISSCSVCVSVGGKILMLLLRIISIVLVLLMCLVCMAAKHCTNTDCAYDLKIAHTVDAHIVCVAAK